MFGRFWDDRTMTREKAWCASKCFYVFKSHTCFHVNSVCNFRIEYFLGKKRSFSPHIVQEQLLIRSESIRKTTYYYYSGKPCNLLWYFLGIFVACLLQLCLRYRNQNRNLFQKDRPPRQNMWVTCDLWTENFFRKVIIHFLPKKTLHRILYSTSTNRNPQIHPTQSHPKTHSVDGIVEERIKVFYIRIRCCIACDLLSIIVSFPVKESTTSASPVVSIASIPLAPPLKVKRKRNRTDNRTAQPWWRCDGRSWRFLDGRS